MIFFFRIQFYSRNCISYFFYLNILLFLVQIRGLAESSNNQPGSAAGATHSEIFSFNSSMGALPLVSPLLSSVRQHQATVSVCLVFFLLFFLVFFLLLLLLLFFLVLIIILIISHRENFFFLVFFLVFFVLFCCPQSDGTKPP